METIANLNSVIDQGIGEDFNMVRVSNTHTMKEFDAGFWVTTRSLWIWFAGSIVTFFLGIFSTALALFKADQVIHKVASLWGRTLLRLVNAKLHTHNIERLHSGASTLVLANHQSISDIFIFYSILNKIQFRWMAKHNLFRIPVIGWAMSGAGYIPVDRSNKKKAQQSIFSCGGSNQSWQVSDYFSGRYHGP